MSELLIIAHCFSCPIKPGNTGTSLHFMGHPSGRKEFLTASLNVSKVQQLSVYQQLSVNTGYLIFG